MCQLVMSHEALSGDNLQLSTQKKKRKPRALREVDGDLGGDVR